MKYQRKTGHYNIPHISEGEVVSAEAEKDKSLIIENQLLGIMKALGDGVIEEGKYRLLINDQKVMKVSLLGLGGTSISGILNAGYFRTVAPVEWDLGVRRKGYFYCWVEFKDATQFKEPSYFTVGSGVERPKNKHLVLAVLDNTGAEPKLMDSPEEKKYLRR